MTLAKIGISIRWKIWSNFSKQVSQEAIATSAEEVLQRLINIDDFNFSSVSHFAVNNMGTLTSVLEQVNFNNNNIWAGKFTQSFYIFQYKAIFLSQNYHW